MQRRDGKAEMGNKLAKPEQDQGTRKPPRGTGCGHQGRTLGEGSPLAFLLLEDKTPDPTAEHTKRSPLLPYVSFPPLKPQAPAFLPCLHPLGLCTHCSICLKCPFSLLALTDFYSSFDTLFKCPLLTSP
jgi:hypothetical protein